MSPILHLVVAALREPSERQTAETTIVHARALKTAPGVMGQVIGQSGAHLVIGTWLESRDVLDAFAASAEHMRFVMQGLAPVIQGMWSAAIETTAAPAFSEIDSTPPVLWAFALPDQEGVYERQVRQFLDLVETIGATAAVGPTVEERDRFRAGGLVSFTTRSDAEGAIASAKAHWTGLGGQIEDALVARVT